MPLIKLSFFLITVIILIFLYKRSLLSYNTSKLKNKIKDNPFIGTKETDNNYYYKEDGFTVGYRIKESPGGFKKIEWLFLKRRLTFLEEKILRAKRDIDNFFSYKRWLMLFQPPVIIVLIISLFIFYFGIKEHSLKRIERFKWVISRITGITPDSIKYAGGGKFTISGEKVSQDRTVDPITISFNPFGWLFFSDTAKVERWIQKQRHVSYSVSIDNVGDVWINKKSGEFHGKIQGNSLIWDKPPGDKYKASSHLESVEDKRLKIIDE